MSFARWRKFQAGISSGRAGYCGLLGINITPFTIADGTAVAAHSFTIPANTLHKNGAALRIASFGTFAADADAGVVNIRIGGISGTVLATVAKTNNGKWYAEATVIRLTATTQASVGVGNVSNTAQETVTVAAPSITLTAATTVVVEADGTNASDIVVTASFVEILTNG